MGKVKKVRKTYNLDSDVVKDIEAISEDEQRSQSFVANNLLKKSIRGSLIQEFDELLKNVEEL